MEIEFQDVRAEVKGTMVRSNIFKSQRAVGERNRFSPFVVSCTKAVVTGRSYYHRLPYI